MDKVSVMDLTKSHFDVVLKEIFEWTWSIVGSTMLKVCPAVLINIVMIFSLYTFLNNQKIKRYTETSSRMFAATHLFLSSLDLVSSKCKRDVGLIFIYFYIGCTHFLKDFQKHICAKFDIFSLKVVPNLSCQIWKFLVVKCQFSALSH